MLSEVMEPGGVTPDRPTARVEAPQTVLRMAVDVDATHLANPILAVQGMLASEAGLFAHVDGDLSRFEVRVALGSEEPAQRELAEAWVRWVLHCAGVRGRVTAAGDRMADAP